MSPPKTSQLNSTLLSLGIGTGDGMLGSASDRQNPHRHRMFHWSILVDLFSFDSWSFPVWERRMRSTGGSMSLIFLTADEGRFTQIYADDTMRLELRF